MDKQQKLNSLQKLSEQELRQNVLIPLLGRMGLRAATEYHGTREHGKDIVCFEVDRLGERRYLGVVAKVTDISGNVASNSGIASLVTQVEQCFNEEYHDLFGMRSVTMDEVWVVTTGRLIPGAADTIIGKLRKTNLDKKLRVVPGERLVELLEEHYPTYWNTNIESIDHLRGHRDRLVQFVRNLFRKMGAAESNVSSVLAELANAQYWLPKVEILTDRKWTVRRANAYSVEIAETADHYTKGLYSDNCGDITEALHKAQKAIEDESYATHQLLDHVAKAITTNDPWEFVYIYESEIEEYYSSSGLRSSDRLRDIEYLIDGLRDVDGFIERLEKAGIREKTLQIAPSVQLLEPEIAEYLKHVDAESFELYWEIMRDADGYRLSLSYDSRPPEDSEWFSTSHQSFVRIRAWEPQTVPISVSNVIEAVQTAFRAHVEKSLPTDSEDCLESSAHERPDPQ